MRGNLKGEKECYKKKRIKKDRKKRDSKEGVGRRIERERREREGGVGKNTNQSMSTHCFMGNGY